MAVVDRPDRAVRGTLHLEYTTTAKEQREREREILHISSSTNVSYVERERKVR